MRSSTDSSTYTGESSRYTLIFAVFYTVHCFRNVELTHEGHPRHLRRERQTNETGYDDGFAGETE